MFGGAENAAVALVMARRDSVPATAHRPKSPLGKTFSLPVGLVSVCLANLQLQFLLETRLNYGLASNLSSKQVCSFSAVSVSHNLENRSFWGARERLVNF